MNIFDLIKKFVTKPHVHNFDKPIVSRYITFNKRDIVFECECGKRELRCVYKPFEIAFPIETTIGITSEEINKILNKSNK